MLSRAPSPNLPPSTSSSAASCQRAGHGPYCAAPCGRRCVSLACDLQLYVVHLHHCKTLVRIGCTYHAHCDPLPNDRWTTDPSPSGPSSNDPFLRSPPRLFLYLDDDQSVSPHRCVVRGAFSSMWRTVLMFCACMIEPIVIISKMSGMSSSWRCLRFKFMIAVSLRLRFCGQVTSARLIVYPNPGNGNKNHTVVSRMGFAAGQEMHLCQSRERESVSDCLCLVRARLSVICWMLLHPQRQRQR